MSKLPEVVLVADDEPHVRLYLRLILKELGVDRIVEASNGREAVKLFLEHKPDLVLLDINMPLMNGTEVLELIMNDTPDANVVMMTGHAARHLIETCQKLGATQYIRKDTGRDEVLELLRDLMHDIFGGEK